MHNNNNEPPREEHKWHDHETKTMDFRYFRSTNLDFNEHITIPKPLDNETEVAMQHLKQNLERVTKEYIKDTKQEQVNLTAEQKEGLKTLKQKQKEGNIIVSETDKTKRFSCDTPDNYKLLATTHTHRTTRSSQQRQNKHLKNKSMRTQACGSEYYKPALR